MTPQDAELLVQHAIFRHEDEQELLQRLGKVMDPKLMQRTIDTLIGTQRVRRIGPEILQNNESHTEVPELPAHLAPLLEQV